MSLAALCGALLLAVVGSTLAEDDTPDLDIILYGATGCVGGIAARHLAGQPGLKWAVAGRNGAEIQQLADALCSEPGTQSCPEQIVAPLDANTATWVKRARAVATAAGPFSIHGGEFLVEACAKLGVHYVDTSDEFFWQRDMIDKYDDAAKASGARVVLAGGFCALAADMGAQLALAALREQGSTDGATMEVDSWLETYNGGLSAGVLHTLAVANKSFPKEWNDDPYLLAPGAAAELRVDTSVTNVKLLDFDWHEGQVTANIFGSYDARLVRRTFTGRGQKVHYRAGAPPTMYAKWVSFLASHPLSWPSLATCPSQAILTGGSWQVRVRAAESECQNCMSKTLVLSGSGDPGYTFTAVSLAEVALCLAGKTVSCLRAAGSGGVQTSMLALEPKVVETRLYTIGLLKAKTSEEEPDTLVV